MNRKKSNASTNKHDSTYTYAISTIHERNPTMPAHSFTKMFIISIEPT